MDFYFDTPERLSRKRYWWLAAIGALIGLTVAGGIYAMLAGGAGRIGGSFDTRESSDHARRLELSTEASRASAEHDADRVACTRSDKKRACNAAAKQRNAAGL